MGDVGDAVAVVLKDGALTAPDGATEKLEDTFRRLGVSAIEEYAEFAPEGVKPDAVKSLYAGKGALPRHARTICAAPAMAHCARKPRASHPTNSRWK